MFCMVEVKPGDHIGRVGNVERTHCTSNESGIADLATGCGVERRAIKHHTSVGDRQHRGG